LSLLTAVAQHILQGDRVTLDLTHGFRHQPILLVMAAIYLRTVRSASIDKVYSSFFDETKNEGELFDLSGLLRLIDWTTALAGYEKDGDLGVFETLLSHDNVSASSLNHLSNAAFAERMHFYTKAFGESRSFANVLEQQRLHGVSGIFQDFLADQLAPKDENNPALRLLRRAQKHLRYGDYDRVALVGEVAFLTHFAEPGEDLADKEILKQIKEQVLNSQRPAGALLEPYKAMVRIRNPFAHIKPPDDKDTRTLFTNEDALRRKLEELLKILEKHILSGGQKTGDKDDDRSR
jgi:CRISPR-associated DxTHG motif protein